MIAERQIAFGRGGKRLPYDAEVEYLESTGTQYIDTGYVMKSLTKYKIDFSCTSSSSASKMLFGMYSLRSADGTIRAQKDNFAANCLGSWAGANASLYIYSYPIDTSSSPFPGNPQTFLCNITQKVGETNTVEYDGGRVLFNGIEVLNAPSVMPDNIFNIPAYLFAAAVRQANTSVQAGYYYEGKIMSVEIWDEQYNKVRDLISVRVGSVGYMYDRVSEQLFGNQGTGAFIIGPDAASANGGGYNRRCIRRSYPFIAGPEIK